MDVRKAAATSVEFSLEDLHLSAAKRAPTKSNAKTVLAGESGINVDRRIRNASVPLGVAVDDVANVSEELTLEGFDLSNAAKHLMPRRPAWSFELSSGRLHHREVEGFKRWLDDVRELIADRGGYPPAFEKNIQVWRQLWRVLERCDVAAVVVDVRHPLLHLPPALVFHVSRTLKKPIVMVLNKLDAVEPSDAARWAAYLQQAIPGISGIVGYSKEHLQTGLFGDLKVGKAALIEACHHAVGMAPKSTATREGMEEAASPEILATGGQGAQTTDLEAGRVMIGLVGHPNVGKSSLINSLMGGKVVSVKATPGHTKTLQTLLLDDKTCLCDSPGLVFPRLNVPREVQIVGMLIPLAQVREPYSAIRWVMEHAVVPLPELLNLRPVTLQQVLDLNEAGEEVFRLDSTLEDTGPVPWSPMLLCAQYAVQRGFVKGGRPDCLLAGTEILQRVLDGRVPYRVPAPASFSPLHHVSPEDNERDSDSDWQIDDEDYESDPEEDPAAANDSLFGYFGIEQKGPGHGSIGSRKKLEKRKKREAAEGVQAQAPAGDGDP